MYVCKTATMGGGNALSILSILDGSCFTAPVVCMIESSCPRFEPGNPPKCKALEDELELIVPGRLALCRCVRCTGPEDLQQCGFEIQED